MNAEPNCYNCMDDGHPCEFCNITEDCESDEMPCYNPNHEILLGIALHGVLIAAGVLDKDSACNGPELLLAANEYIKYKGL